MSVDAIETAGSFEMSEPVYAIGEDREAESFAAIMIVLPIPLLIVAERVRTKCQDWLLEPKQMIEDAFWLAFAGPVSIPGIIGCTILVMLISSFVCYWFHRVQHESLFW